MMSAKDRADRLDFCKGEAVTYDLEERGPSGLRDVW